MNTRGFKSRGRAKPNNDSRAKVTKGRPKLSKDEEETQAMTLFDDSIPTALRSKNIQKVVNDGSAPSTEESEEAESNPMNQLMSVLGVNTTQRSSSDEGESGEADEGDGNGEDQESEESGASALKGKKARYRIPQKPSVPTAGRKEVVPAGTSGTSRLGKRRREPSPPRRPSELDDRERSSMSQAEKDKLATIKAMQVQALERKAEDNRRRVQQIRIEIGEMEQEVKEMQREAEKLRRSTSKRK